MNAVMTYATTSDQAQRYDTIRRRNAENAYERNVQYNGQNQKMVEELVASLVGKKEPENVQPEREKFKKLDAGQMKQMVFPIGNTLERTIELWRDVRAEAVTKPEPTTADYQLAATATSKIMQTETLFNLNTSIREKYHYISGLHHYINANYQECIPLFISVLKMNEDPLLHARLNFNIALAYFRLTQYNEALEFVNKAKDYHLNLHNWKSTADCYNLIGVLYKGKKDFSNAEIYTRKGLHIVGDTDKIRQARLQHNLALIYKEQGELNKALETINTSLILKEKYDLDDLFITYHGKLIILSELQDEKSLLITIDLARSTCITKLNKIHLQVFEARLYLLQNNYSKYEKCMQQSIDYYFKQERLDDLKDLAEELAEHYAERKQYKKAYELNKKCIIALKNI